MAKKCSKKSYRSWKSVGRLNRLPRDLVSEILSHVASASCADLFSAQQACKSLHEAGSENYVLERATMDQIAFVNWDLKNSSLAAFMNRLEECENPEALFRIGMIDCFSKNKVEEGLEFLGRAAEKGHALATYVYGVILVCYGGSDKENGVKILCSLEKNGESREIIVGECRRQIKPLLSQLWIRYYIVGWGPNDEHLTSQGCVNGCVLRWNKRGWRSDDEVDTCDCCHSCFWGQEGRKFCNMLLRGNFES